MTESTNTSLRSSAGSARIAAFLRHKLQGIWCASRRVLRPCRSVIAVTGLLALAVISMPQAVAQHGAEFQRNLAGQNRQISTHAENEQFIRQTATFVPPKPVLKPAVPAFEPPADFSEGILIDISQRKLHWIVNGKTERSFGVAVPREGYRTYYGDTSVTNLRPNPVWVPTPNMRRKNPSLPASVGPGPANPLGTKAIGTGWKYIYIHGTNRPDSIGTRASSGCFRMHNADVEWLFDKVKKGTPVRVQP